MWFIFICLGIFIIFSIAFSRKDKEINRLRNENYELKHPVQVMKERLNENPVTNFIDNKPAANARPAANVKIENELPVYINEAVFHDVFQLEEIL
jgi:hypothetical protein